MVTRALFLCLGWFVISFAAVFVFGKRDRTTSAFQSLLLVCIQPAQAVPLAYSSGTSSAFSLAMAAANSS